MKKEKWGMLAALLLAALLGTGCGNTKTESAASGDQSVTGQTVEEASSEKSGSQPKEAASEKDSVVVVMGPSSEPEAGFDPAYGWGAGEHVHEPLIQSTLTVTATDLKIGYDLAEAMEVTEDGLTWTVKIRGDVCFTDGERLTAEDVAFTYNTLRDTSSVNDFTMLDRAEAKDETTVVFHMKRDRKSVV